MTAASDAGRVVAWQYRQRGLDEKWYDCNKMFFDREAELHVYETRELVPAATLSALQRRLDAVGELAEKWEQRRYDSLPGDSHRAAELRALLGGDATTNEETK